MVVQRACLGSWIRMPVYEGSFGVTRLLTFLTDGIYTTGKSSRFLLHFLAGLDIFRRGWVLCARVGHEECTLWSFFCTLNSFGVLLELWVPD